MSYLPEVRKGKLLLQTEKKTVFKRRREIKNARKLWREYCAMTTFILKLVS